MSGSFRKLAVLGLGLLGGSVALAARRAGVTSHISGSARRRAPLERALADGVVDSIGAPDEVVRGAQLVVLASPVGAMPALVEAIAPALEPGALVTDVGSVKGVLAELLPGRLPAGVHFVGAHPMAGSHLRGVEHARGDLFEGAPCAVTPGPGCPEPDAERVREFWRALGARVVARSPEDHDADVAWTSHVPHALAFAFAHALGEAAPRAGELAGSGFRDFTRIARSDAELWGDILAANRKALSAPLAACQRALADLSVAIEAGDADSIERFLETARQRLAFLANARSGGEDPDATAPRSREPASESQRGREKEETNHHV